MKDFCQAADKDCIRLIVAQDLKESAGIDIDTNAISPPGLSRSVNCNAVGCGGGINDSGGILASITNSNTSSNSYFISKQSNGTASNGAFGSNRSTSITTEQAKIINSSCCGSVGTATPRSGADSLSLSHHLHHNGHYHHHCHNHNHHHHHHNRIFGIALRQLEATNVIVNEQALYVPK
jgi:hypothetical protein